MNINFNIVLFVY